MTVHTALSRRFSALIAALRSPALWKEVGRIVWDAIRYAVIAFVLFVAGFAYLMVAIPYTLAVGSTPATVMRGRSRR